MTVNSHHTSWHAQVAAAFREQAPLIALVALVVAIGYLAEAVTGLTGQMRQLWYRSSYLYFIRILAMPLPIAFLWGRLKVTDADGVWLQGVPGWKAAWRRFLDVYLNPRVVTAAVLSGLMVAAAINVFGTWKLAIPKLHPFEWDVRLSALDKTLHFGRQPWEWLRPALENATATNVLDFAYYTWLPLVAIVCAWQSWSPRRELRLRFFLTFVLTWIVLGDIMAEIFSSAGPPYWDYVVGGVNPYRGLFEHLTILAKQMPLGTPIVQAGLWQRYTSATQNPYTGISAMPSIHVSMPVLYALVGWRTWKPLGVAFAAYGVVILLGSIHLGWHYAVDGYASILGVLLLWYASSLLLRIMARKGWLRPAQG